MNKRIIIINRNILKMNIFDSIYDIFFNKLYNIIKININDQYIYYKY